LLIIYEFLKLANIDETFIHFHTKILKTVVNFVIQKIA